MLARLYLIWLIALQSKTFVDLNLIGKMLNAEQKSSEKRERYVRDITKQITLALQPQITTRA